MLLMPLQQLTKLLLRLAEIEKCNNIKRPSLIGLFILCIAKPGWKTAKRKSYPRVNILL